MSEDSMEKPEHTPSSSGNPLEGTSCSVSSGHNLRENQQNPNLNKVLLPMNKTINASNQLLVEFLSSQRKRTRVEELEFGCDSDGPLEPLQKRQEEVLLISMLKNVQHMIQLLKLLKDCM